MILIVIGYLLGGWAVAAVTAVFALFIFGVALAGTQTTKDRLEQRRAKGLAPTMEPTEPAPTVVTHAIGQIEARAAAVLDRGQGVVRSGRQDAAIVKPAVEREALRERYRPSATSGCAPTVPTSTSR